MMGRLSHDQEQFFYSFHLDEAVPDDHPVREIAAVLDLSWVHSELAPYYSQLGRPSIDPLLMIRMLIVGYVFAIRSERALCRSSAACDCAGRAGLNSSSRWQPSLRTSAGWPSSWHGRLRSRPHAWRERQVTPSRVGIGRVVPAIALTGEWQAKLSLAPTAAFLFGDFCNKIGTHGRFNDVCSYVGSWG
jgi:Transposase domain (DUF772)